MSQIDAGEHPRIQPSPPAPRARFMPGGRPIIQFGRWAGGTVRRGKSGVPRRRFLKGGGAAGVAAAISRPSLVYAQTKKDIKFPLPWLAEGSNLIAYVARA